MSNIVARQHVETEISEIVGDTIESILAIRGASSDTLVLFYIFVRGVWLRIFLDAGVLFLKVCDSPDAEDDLDDGNEYFDFSGAYSIKGQEISKASMKNGVFRIAFKSGVELIFEENGEETEFQVLR